MTPGPVRLSPSTQNHLTQRHSWHGAPKNKKEILCFAFNVRKPQRMRDAPSRVFAANPKKARIRRSCSSNAQEDCSGAVPGRPGEIARRINYLQKPKGGYNE